MAQASSSSPVLREIPAGLDPDRIVRDERFDPSMLDEYTPRAQQVLTAAIARRDAPKERSWTDAAVSTGLRVVPAVLGGMAAGALGSVVPFAGTAAGIAAGSASGGALGAYLDQLYQGEDFNLTDFAVSGALNAIPTGKIVTGAGRTVLRTIAPGVERRLAGMLAPEAASVGAGLLDRINPKELAKTVVKNAATGAVVAPIENTVVRTTQGQPTTGKDLLQEATMGTLLGGVTPVAVKAATQLPVRKIVGATARLPIFNELPVSAVSTIAGLLTGSNPTTMALNAAGGNFVGKNLNKAIAAARKLGLPPAAVEVAPPLIRTATQALDDVNPLVQELDKFKVLTKEALEKGKEVVTAVADADAAGAPVPTLHRTQAERIVAANNEFNVDTKTIPAMRLIVANIIDDKVIRGNISMLPSERASKLLIKVTDGIDAMDRAGRPVPEELRQVFEALQDRFGSESADAMSTLIGAARQGTEALSDAISTLTSTREGKAIYGSIQSDRTTRLALESAKRLATNAGGTLTQPSKPKSNQLLDILESMGRRVEEVQVAPESLINEGYRIPSGVDVVRTGRGAAVSVETPTPADTALVTLFDAASEGLASFNKAIAALRSSANGESTYGAIQRRYRDELTQLKNLALKSGGKLNTTKRESVDQLRELLEPSFSRVESVQVAPERPVGGGFTIPPDVDVVRTGRGAAVSVDAMPEPTPEVTADSSTTPPQAQTPRTQAPVQPRKRSTVEERAVARGAEPLVRSGILTPDEIRAALSNRPDLQVVLDAQELKRNKVRLIGDTVLSRFREGYKSLVGEYPREQTKDYTVGHVAGHFYSGGQNAVNPKETALRKQLLRQFGIEE